MVPEPAGPKYAYPLPDKDVLVTMGKMLRENHRAWHRLVAGAFQSLPDANVVVGGNMATQIHALLARNGTVWCFTTPSDGPEAVMETIHELRTHHGLSYTAACTLANATIWQMAKHNASVIAAIERDKAAVSVARVNIKPLTQMSTGMSNTMVWFRVTHANALVFAPSAVALLEPLNSEPLPGLVSALRRVTVAKPVLINTSSICSAELACLPGCTICSTLMALCLVRALLSETVLHPAKAIPTITQELFDAKFIPWMRKRLRKMLHCSAVTLLGPPKQ